MSADLWAAPRELHDFVYKHLDSGSTVLEIGSGSGSQALAALHDVYSVEHDPEFLDKYPDVNYVYAPIVNGWYSRDALEESISDLRYDLVIVDGPPGRIGRGGFLYNLDLFADVPVLLDDVNREPERELAFAVAKKLGKPISVHHLPDGRAFASIGVDLW